MKKTLYIGLVAASLTMTACNMDQTPFSEVASGNYVKDDKSVNTLVIGAYNALHNAMYYEWAMTELRSDDARSYSNNSTSNTTKLMEQLDQSTITPEHEWVEKCWKGYYDVISRANNVLGCLDKVADEKTRCQYEGEARFLRALEYFNLVRLWGPVFIVKTKTPSEVARNMQRSTTEEVYKLIEDDLERIVNDQLLPEEMPSEDLGRADLVAAKALLAKVYATHYGVDDDHYKRAASLCMEVLKSTRVGNPQSAADLVPYGQIFSTSNEMNREIIFAVRYTSGNVGLGAPFGNLFAPLNNGGNVIVGASSGCNCPSDNIIAAYTPDDARLDVNIAQKYYNATTKQWVTTGNCRYPAKWVAPVTTAFDGEKDWPVIRVGDIALLYAELQNELYGPSDDALKYLNMIRQRAGVAAYELSDVADKYAFQQAVRNERRLELAFENQRWFDLMRWGVAVQTVNAYLKDESFYRGYNYNVRSIASWQTYLPIPMSVLNINPSVAQNAGY